MKIILFALLALAIADHPERLTYEGYKVYDVVCQDASQKRIVSDMSPTVDIWRHTQIPGDKSKLLVSPARDKWFKRQLQHHQIQYSLSSTDFNAIIEQNFAERKDDFDINAYNSLDTIYAEMVLMADDCAALDLHCDVRSLGETYEGRDMNVLVIKTGAANKPGIVVDAATHTREWIAVSSAVNLMDKLSRYYGIDSEVTQVIDMFDWYIIPVINPDGYAYSYDVDPNWKKTRKPNEGTDCFGTDMNKNFDWDWENEGSSTDPCDSTYKGSSPVSEQETQAVQEAAWQLAAEENIISWTSIHAVGDMWIYPYGGSTDGSFNGTCIVSEHEDDLFKPAEAACLALQDLYDISVWQYGSVCEIVFPYGGGLIDYTHGNDLVKYSYNPVLRGEDFQVPTSEIEPAFHEFWVGLREQVLTIYDIEFPE